MSEHMSEFYNVREIYADQKHTEKIIKAREMRTQKQLRDIAQVVGLAMRKILAYAPRKANKHKIKLEGQGLTKEKGT